MDVFFIHLAMNFGLKWLFSSVASPPQSLHFPYIGAPDHVNGLSGPSFLCHTRHNVAHGGAAL